MAESTVCFGRDAELKAFDEVLRRPEGEAILVVGNEGFGKTTLLQRIAECAADHPELRCGAVQYQVAPTDPVEATMGQMIYDAYKAAKRKPGSFTLARVEQWRTLLNLVNPNLGDLVVSLVPDPKRSARESLLDALRAISTTMDENARALFFIDPEKYLPDQSDDAWAIVIRNLPSKVKLIFAQRADGALVGNETIQGSKNVVRIPHGLLSALNDVTLEEWVQSRATRLPCSPRQAIVSLSRYGGHPYAIAAALDLLEEGLAIGDLPSDPMGIANAQWTKICQHGTRAIRLFFAYSILDVPATYDLASTVAEIGPDDRRQILANRFLNTRLAIFGNARRIYHGLLSDRIRNELPEAEAKAYHKRAAEEYRRLLNTGDSPDATAARRLPLHVFAADGKEAFVKSVISESSPALRLLGLFADCEALLVRASVVVKTGSAWEAAVFSHLGLVKQTIGDLNESERLHLKAIEANRALGRHDAEATEQRNLGTIYLRRSDFPRAEKRFRLALAASERSRSPSSLAAHYSCMGLFYQQRGDFERAEEFHKKALKIDKELRRRAEVAGSYGNLGNIELERGNYDRAEEYCRRALELFQELGDRARIANQLANLGVILDARGQPLEAEQMLRDALEIDEALGRSEAIANDCNNLGLVYWHCNALDDAERLFDYALNVFERLGLSGLAANACGNLGAVERDRGNFDRARDLVEKALATHERLGLKVSVLTGYETLASIYFGEGNREAASAWYARALTLAERLGVKELIADCCAMLGEISRLEENYKEAREYLSRAAREFDELGFTEKLKRVQEKLTELPPES